MSAYSASAPVNASTIAPTAANTIQPRSARKWNACSGLSAPRTAGVWAICCTPVIASNRNHSTMIGPNSLPTTPVPLRCMTNSAISTPMAIGSTKRFRPGSTTSRPSTALSTDIAGVITLSP